ncbi:hypothetical protein ABZ896_42660 [Streptomyces sp. NPDC047072]|uniref:hypothetical protein n=1 Tax=Streptomyces sp. NPDC047072 TaxID=3154809 RepID=UPI00340BC9E3
MHTPADIAQLAAGILGGAWAAERGAQGATVRLTAPGTDAFALRFDDHGHLRVGTVFGGPGEIARFPDLATGDTETIARAVAQAIRQHLATSGGEWKAALYQDLNLGAHFSCADYSDPQTPCHPSVTIAGAACFFYVDEAGEAQISAETDGLTAVGARIWDEEAVPLRITLNGDVVFTTTGTWVVQFQHPEDGGDDGVWEYTIPAQEAPTKAAARAAATERFVADINSRANADAWDGSTIRSLRFTAQPR